MSFIKSVLFSAVFLSSMAWAGESAGGRTDADLKLRVEGYLHAMLHGEEAAVLSARDYYSVVYLTSKASVEKLTPEADGSYRATLVFETTGRILQNAESVPPQRSEVTQKETLHEEVLFSVDAASLKWKQKLTQPFVLSGHEKRYVFLQPSKKRRGAQ